MSTTKRNNLGPENLVRCAQLNQYWRYGFGSSEPSDHIVAGIPTLRDLLNADTVEQHPIDEEALFNHPDPYGLKDFEEMEEGEDDTDTAPPPLARFVSDQEKPQPEVPVAAKKPSQQPSSKWTATDTDWDAAACTNLDPVSTAYGYQLDDEKHKALKAVLGKLEKTAEVSGGGKQRLVASRAFMRFRTGKIKQLCVDEPSNTLNPKGEHALFERLRETGARRTMIFVTHRFGHLTKYADIIIVRPKAFKSGSRDPEGLP
ncbi:hypothetical protein B0H10DRAFT_2438416 [Mycena sp. CBHHK59/15]|nr:hypothetical protein B0H10DRAFT_2438416 [Mycena sp. CBHHK59/15]